ncbi:ABC transporter substrate-binding protein [Methylomonas sp. 11b]|uniref:ABC transporter substrate-binding protein n=1 Tax=Methylomonas sp. 11b TaxID=1168169 RepID=UPI0018CC52FA|nr:ABC transporter substrate-binding protein [Methylomonas sp. 11b]
MFYVRHGGSILAKSLLILIYCTLLAACQESSPQNPKSVSRITVAFTYQPESVLMHVAMAQGYFAEEGLEVEPQIHSFGKAALQSVVEGKADFATVAETPLMFSILRGEKVAVIANIVTSSSNHAIAARQDASISKLSDLKGKRVGFTPGTTSEFFLDSILTASGLMRSEIEPVALNPEEMQESLTLKKVDAVCTWNYPLIQIQRQLGSAVTVFYDRDIYTETFNIAVLQAFIEKKPETIKSFLRALLKAERFVAEQPDAAQTIMASATKVELGLIKSVWDDFSYELTLDQTLLITLEDETRWAMKNRLTDQVAMPNFQQSIHMDSLAAIKPAILTLYR